MRKVKNTRGMSFVVVQGARLWALRKAWGLTIKEVVERAEKMNRSFAYETYRKAEQADASTVTIQVAQNIAAVFNVGPEMLADPDDRE